MERLQSGYPRQRNNESAYNNKIEATGNKLGGFSRAGCPCASFRSLYPMKKETSDLVIVISGILLVVMMGIGMLRVTRWSRKKNAELREKGDASQLAAVKSINTRGISGETIKAYFAGTVSDPEKNIGKLLAIIGVAVCLVFLVFACLAVIKFIK